jgi:phage terminase large subunit
VEGEEFDGREFTPGNMTLADFTPRIFADPAASPLITAMRNRGITVTLANNDVLDGISCVATLIRKRLIRIHNTRCPMLKKELGAYAWDEKSSKLGKEQPMKMNDHTPDALKYACFTSLAKWRYASDY